MLGYNYTQTYFISVQFFIILIYFLILPCVQGLGKTNDKKGKEMTCHYEQNKINE